MRGAGTSSNMLNTKYFKYVVLAVVGTLVVALQLEWLEISYNSQCSEAPTNIPFPFQFMAPTSSINPSVYFNESVASAPSLDDIVLYLDQMLPAPTPSKRGKVYRSVICTIFRNEGSIVEFIVRHLLLGFSHIAINDDNRIAIERILAPFILSGRVSYNFRNNTSMGLLVEEGMGKTDCVETWRDKTDWLSVIDNMDYSTDGELPVNRLINYLEEKRWCCAVAPWTMMYGEPTLQKSKLSLMESYPRMCRVHSLGKPLMNTDKSNYDLPHGCKCKWYTLSSPLRGLDIFNARLVHYYSRSIEHQVTKIEQSVTPYIRSFTSRYDPFPCSINHEVLQYSSQYVEKFLKIFNYLKSINMLDPITLQSPPPMKSAEIADYYNLYLYFKWRVAEGYEWNEELYLKKNNLKMTFNSDRKWEDGLHHFIQNFGKTGKEGCWNLKGRSFCN